MVNFVVLDTFEGVVLVIKLCYNSSILIKQQNDFKQKLQQNII